MLPARHFTIYSAIFRSFSSSSSRSKTLFAQQTSSQTTFHHLCIHFSLTLHCQLTILSAPSLGTHCLLNDHLPTHHTLCFISRHTLFVERSDHLPIHTTLCFLHLGMDASSANSQGTSLEPTSTRYIYPGPSPYIPNSVTYTDTYIEIWAPNR